MWWTNQSHIFGLIVHCFIPFVFIVCQVEVYQNILKLSYRSLRFTSYQIFSKNEKQVWNQSPWLIFCITFEDKYFSFDNLLIDQVSLSSYLYCVRYWAICAFPLFVTLGYDIMNFEINLIFLIKPFFLHGKNSSRKIKYLENEKSF